MIFTIHMTHLHISKISNHQYCTCTDEFSPASKQACKITHTHNPTLSAQHLLPQIRVFVYGSVLQCIALVAVCCKVVLCVAQDQIPSKLFSKLRIGALHAIHNSFNMTTNFYVT